MNEDLSYSRELLGKFLKEIRERQGYSFRELGRIAGISGSHIYRMESAKFDCMLETFIKLTAALGIPPGWAIDRAMGSRPSAFRDSLTKSRTVERLYQRLAAQHRGGKYVVDSFIEALCASAVQLIRSGNPTATLHHLKFDDQIRTWFSHFAESLSGSVSFEDRAEMIRALSVDGLTEILRLKICSEVQIARYLQEFVQRASEWSKAGSPEEIAERLLSGKFAVPVWYPSPAGFFDESLQKKSLEYKEKPLDSAYVPPIPSTITQLIARVKMVTKLRGSRAQLARHLGVMPQQVNDWLQGKNTPGGEATLQLLKWVEAEEASVTQQKSNPERALTRPGRMTRNRKVTSNEKPKSGRSKR